MFAGCAVSECQRGLGPLRETETDDGNGQWQAIPRSGDEVADGFLGDVGGSVDVDAALCSDVDPSAANRYGERSGRLGEERTNSIAGGW